MKQILGTLGLLALTFGLARFACTAHHAPETIYFFTQGGLTLEQMEDMRQVLTTLDGVEAAALHDGNRAFKMTINPSLISGTYLRRYIACAEYYLGATENCGVTSAQQLLDA